MEDKMMEAPKRGEGKFGILQIWTNQDSGDNEETKLLNKIYIDGVLNDRFLKISNVD